VKQWLHFIDGQSSASVAGEFLDNVEPATGKVYSQVARGDAEDVTRAVEAAHAAFPAWSATSADERSRLLLALASIIERDIEKFAQAESVDCGKPLSLARSLDIPRAISNLRFFATAILHTRSEAHLTDRMALNYTLRRPRGVAGLISPWNLPLYLLTWKVAPALATGNTAVAKPSELTPATASMLGEAAAEAGLPRGVLNIVHGLGAEAGAAIVEHPAVPTLSFTGGTATGAAISRVAAPMFKKLALELGGKNANVIFADADLDLAIETSVRSSFANQGQVCLCGSRIFIERPAFEHFVGRFVPRVERLSLGDPLQSGTEQGALISAAHRDKVMGYIDLAREEGGKILCGGRRATALPERCRDGFFVEPTVVSGLDAASRINQEEIFGPVVSLIPFDDEPGLVAAANSTPYGLSASVWTRDLSRAHSIAEQLDVGTVWINCWLLRDLRVPFGGTKQSGVGREGGEEAVRFFTEPKNVCLRYHDAEAATES